MIEIINNFEPVRRESSNWRVDIVLNPEERTVAIYPFFGNGQSMRAYNGVDVRLASFTWQDWADIAPIVEFLENEAQEDLEAIVEGHAIRWDGSNHRGSLTEEASLLADHLRDRLTARAEYCPCFWSAEEFWGGAGFFGRRFWREEGDNVVNAGSVAEWAEAEVQRHLPEYYLDAKDVAEFAAEQIQNGFDELEANDRALALRILNKAEVLHSCKVMQGREQIVMVAGKECEIKFDFTFDDDHTDDSSDSSAVNGWVNGRLLLPSGRRVAFGGGWLTGGRFSAYKGNDMGEDISLWWHDEWGGEEEQETLVLAVQEASREAWEG